jgi:methionyl-tRNA formyltransferase
MRVGFVGSIEFSWHVLKVFLKKNINVVGVWGVAQDYAGTISDYRSLADLAQENAIPFTPFRKITDPDIVAGLKKADLDLILIMGLSQILPPEILSMAPQGVVGSHPTLLPQGRGRAAIPWSILKGLKKSGLSFFFLAKEVDAGDIICQSEWEITEQDTAATLYSKMISAGCRLAETLSTHIKKGQIPRMPQPSTGDYWPGRKPQDGLIFWEKSAKEIYDLVRATTHPYPGAFSYLKGKKVFFWEAQFEKGSAQRLPGEIMSLDDHGVRISTSDGVLKATRLSVEGEKEGPVDAFIRQHGIKIGDRLNVHA